MTTPTPPLLPLASDGCGCCAPSTASATTSDPVDITTDTTPDGSTVYQVTGMTCGHCASSVTEAIRALPQVEDVQIDLAAGGISTVTVTGAASPQTVEDAIAAAGYSVIS